MYQTTLRNGSTKPKSTNNSLATLRQRQNYPTKEKTLHKKWVVIAAANPAQQNISQRRTFQKNERV